MRHKMLICGISLLLLILIFALAGCDELFGPKYSYASVTLNNEADYKIIVRCEGMNKDCDPGSSFVCYFQS